MYRQSDLPGDTWESWNIDFPFLPSFLILAIRFQTSNANTMACRHLLTVQATEFVQRKQKIATSCYSIQSSQKLCGKRGARQQGLDSEGRRKICLKSCGTTFFHTFPE